jgi:two-component system, cell cycle response regulator
LIVQDDAPAAEQLMRAVESAGLACSWERVNSEAALHEALGRGPEIILCDAEVTGISGMAALAIARTAKARIPFIFIAGNVESSAVRQARRRGASGYVSKADVAALVSTVRTALRRQRKDAPPNGKRARAGTSSGVADYLIERRAVLDRTLQHQDRSAMSMILRRTPPSPTALLTIEAPPVRERFAKLLRNANIEIEEAHGIDAALERLEERIHAVMFTDRIDLISASRRLYTGAATHVVFVNSGDASAKKEALRAGANECLPAEPDGEEFWAHLTTARRIVSLAGSLQLALLDNRVLSTVDELTGSGSRRFFEQEFPREVERARQLDRPLALVMCDIDHFKQVNDLHGHPAGDEVLSEFGERLSTGLRLGRDWLARVGGEEFAVVLPDTSSEEAVRIAERLRQQIMVMPFWTAAGRIPITASFGVSGFLPSSGSAPKVADLIEAADRAMYTSKRAGRNRVTAA